MLHKKQSIERKREQEDTHLRKKDRKEARESTFPTYYSVLTAAQSLAQLVKVIPTIHKLLHGAKMGSLGNFRLAREVWGFQFTFPLPPVHYMTVVRGRAGGGATLFPLSLVLKSDGRDAGREVKDRRYLRREGRGENSSWELQATNETIRDFVLPHFISYGGPFFSQITLYRIFCLCVFFITAS